MLVILGGVIFLVALFYAEEDWRGKRAWENCKRELEAKGMVLDWEKFIPPRVPDDQNIFKAPRMLGWFVGRGATDLSKRLLSTTEAVTASVSLATNSITTPSAATDYLAWSDQFIPDFDLIRAALKRPYAWMDGDYSEPFGMLIPNFVTARACAQMLAQRAHCYLLLGQPEKALNELSLLNDSRHIEEREPTGQPMTLVEAMINVAITGLYVNTIADGFRLHAWQEPQLVALQEQLARIDLPPFVAQSFKCESAAVCRAFETTMVRKIISMTDTPSGGRSFWQTIKDWRIHVFDLVPRGWVYQNMATLAKLDARQLDGFYFENGTILPGKVGELRKELEAIMSHPSPYTYIAVIGVPNTTKAMQTLAYNQTLVNEAHIVCALERYRLAHGAYPETLDALVPQFIEKLPHDIIGGQPLHYRRTDGGKFLLYSVGWNETDDGGQVAPMKDGRTDMENGDWVWKN